MNLERYLERIRYSGSMTPTAETLSRLHRAHMMHIPFENLDIHLNREIILDEDRLFEKMVTNQRGGFCFEQNGLFAVMLRAMGYHVTLHQAQVYDGNGNYSLPFTHLMLMVNLEENWLVDVGFGESFIEPLEMDNPAVQLQNGKSYRVQHDGKTGMYSATNDEGDWIDQYRFTLAPQVLSDFNEGCHWIQTSPESTFTQRRVCSMATETGRITLRDNRLIVTENGERHETPIEDEAAFHAALKQHFGMVLISEETP